VERSKHISSTGTISFFLANSFRIKRVTNLAINLLSRQQEEIPMDADIKTAVCTEYERLLKESHQALSEYNEHLEWDDELRNLQAKYDKAHWNLRNHARNCELCSCVARISVLAAA